jgi:hypothetical protein
VEGLGDAVQGLFGQGGAVDGTVGVGVIRDVGDRFGIGLVAFAPAVAPGAVAEGGGAEAVAMTDLLGGIARQIVIAREVPCDVGTDSQQGRTTIPID